MSEAAAQTSVETPPTNMENISEQVVHLLSEARGEDIVISEADYPKTREELTAHLNQVRQAGTDSMTFRERIKYQASEGFGMTGLSLNMWLVGKFVPVLHTLGKAALWYAGGTYAMLWFQGVKQGRLYRASITTPYNSRITIMQSVRSHQGVRAGDVLLDVTPGWVAAEKECQAGLATEQLYDLRESTRGVPYDHIVIPYGIARAVSDNRTVSRQKVLENITGREMADDATKAKMWSRATFEALTKNLEMHHADTLHQVLTELLRRTPNQYVEALANQLSHLEAGLPQLKRYLSQTLVHGLEDELDQAARGQWWRDKNGSKKQSLTIRLVEANGQLVAHQYNEEQRLVHAYVVARLAAIEEPIDSKMFQEKLHGGNYSTAQLAYLATVLLRNRHVQAEDMTVDEPNETLRVRRAGMPGLPGTIADPEIKRAEGRRRLNRRIILIAGLLATSSLVKAIGALPFDNDHGPKWGGDYQANASFDHSPLGRANPVDSVDWQVGDKGIGAAGYFSVRNYDHFAGKQGWLPSPRPLQTVLSGNSQPPDHAPYLQLVTTTSASTLRRGIWLPVQEDTVLRSMEVVTDRGDLVDGVEVLTDGTGEFVRANPRESTASFTVIAAFTKMPEKITPSDDLTAWAVVFSEASTIAHTYKYDNTNALNKISKQAKTPQRLLGALDKYHICNCNLCASRLALLADAQGIRVHYTAGYMNNLKSAVDSIGDQGLEARELHAWITMPDGIIVDSTPIELSEAEARARAKERSAEVPKKDDVSLPAIIFTGLGAMAVLSAGEAHSLVKRLRKRWRLRQFGRPSTRQAHMFLNWVAYGHPIAAPSLAASRASADDLLQSARVNLQHPKIHTYIQQPKEYEATAHLSRRQARSARRLARKAIKGKL